MTHGRYITQRDPRSHNPRMHVQNAEPLSKAMSDWEIAHDDRPTSCAGSNRALFNLGDDCRWREHGSQWGY